MGSLIKKAFCSLSFVSMFFITPALQADTQYSYTGKTYTSATLPYTKLMSVQGYFTTANPLDINLIGADISGIILAYSFFDGQQTLNSTNSTIIGSVSTSNLGNISEWDIFVTNSINSGFFIGINTSFDGVRSGPTASTITGGTWVVSEVVVPEPGTYATLAGALTLVGLVASKRRKVSIR